MAKRKAKKQTIDPKYVILYFDQQYRCWEVFDWSDTLATAQSSYKEACQRYDVVRLAKGQYLKFQDFE